MLRARPVLAVLVAVVALLAPAGLVAAAELVDVSGTVRDPGGSLAPGVEVLVSVAGSDIVVPATTDANGAFAAVLEASIGDTVEVRATGPTVSSGPDEEGCIRSSTPTGRASVVIEEIPLAPVDVVLATAIETEVCAATGTPDPTPPSTDAVGAPAHARPGGGVALVLAMAWLAALGPLLTVRRRA